MNTEEKNETPEPVEAIEPVNPAEPAQDGRPWVEQVREASNRYFDELERKRTLAIYEEANAIKSSAMKFALETGCGKMMLDACPREEVHKYLVGEGFEIKEVKYYLTSTCELIWNREQESPELPKAEKSAKKAKKSEKKEKKEEKVQKDKTEEKEEAESESEYETESGSEYESGEE